MHPYRQDPAEMMSQAELRQMAAHDPSPIARARAAELLGAEHGFRPSDPREQAPTGKLMAAAMLANPFVAAALLAAIMSRQLARKEEHGDFESTVDLTARNGSWQDPRRAPGGSYCVSLLAQPESE